MGESLVQWGDPEGLLTASVGLLQPGLGLHANHTGPRSYGTDHSPKDHSPNNRSAEQCHRRPLSHLRYKTSPLLSMFPEKIGDA